MKPRGGAIAVGGAVTTAGGGLIVTTADKPTTANASHHSGASVGGVADVAKALPVTTNSNDAAMAGVAEPRSQVAPTGTETTADAGALAVTGSDTAAMVTAGLVITAVGIAVVVLAAVLVRVGWRRQRPVASR